MCYYASMQIAIIAALLLSEQPSRFLSTVQIGITLVGIMAGTFGGATIARDLAETLLAWGVPPEASFRVAIALVVAITTYVTLVIGELVPKQIAIGSPESVASRVALPMRILSFITLPLVFILSASTRVILVLLGRKKRPRDRVSEDEVRLLFRQGAESGVFRTAEAKMVEGVFRLDDIRADAIMTPRVDVIWLRVDADRAEILAAVKSGHGAFPVCETTIDNVRGVVHLSELTRALLEYEELDLGRLASPPEVIPESANAADLIDRVAETGSTFLVIVGEHGGLDGIVTAHDLAEAVLGDLGPAEVHATADGEWRVSGSIAIQELEAAIGVPEMRQVRTQAYSTLAGFVMSQIGAIPRGGRQESSAGQVWKIDAGNDAEPGIRGGRQHVSTARR